MCRWWYSVKRLYRAIRNRRPLNPVRASGNLAGMPDIGMVMTIAIPLAMLLGGVAACYIDWRISRRYPPVD